MQVSAVAMLALAACTLMSLSTVDACCSRKPDFGCCGMGSCNVFCCNCDGGCNKECENTHCDTGDWLKCGVKVTACGAACVATEGAGCIACMGPLYETCKKCFGSNSLATNSRQSFFAEVNINNDTGIDADEFKAYKINLEGEKKVLTSKCWTHKGWDKNNDGKIDEQEFSDDHCDKSDEKDLCTTSKATMKRPQLVMAWMVAITGWIIIGRCF